MDSHDPAPDTPVTELMPTLQRLRTAWQQHKPDARQRSDDLQRLHAAFKARLDQMAEVISADFGGRSRHESLLADGMTVLNEIAHLRGRLRSWMRPRRVGAGWRLWPARARVVPQPVGVVGVISPWNYPVNLALIPLATAIAAGNHVLLKPSEHTPRTAQWLRTLLAEVFPADRVAVVTGGPDLAAAFSGLPLDHLVFTGSTAVGKKVMAAAAANLVPVTLELGGKSPAIICPDYPLDKAAARLATGKWFNGGQTCIAPDYVLVDAARRDAFIDAFIAETRRRYSQANAGDFTNIIHAGQQRRLLDYLQDARQRGLTVHTIVETGGPDAVPPSVVVQPGNDALVMQEEIFGPILPVIGYDALDDAIAFVQRRDRPLALYPFSHDRGTIDRILSQLLAGGVTVNDTLLHFAANRLPFGGVGPSGMGAYHGRAGFDGMSKLLPVLHQSRLAASDRLKPPYAKVDGLIRLLLR